MVAHSHLVRKLEGTFKTELRLWRTDVASSPECRAESNHDIESASMVIMAFRRPEAVAGDSWEWRNVGGERHSHCPVAAALGTAITFYSSRGFWNHILHGATSEIQMDIFLWMPQLLPQSPAASGSQTEPRGNSIPALSPNTGNSTPSTHPPGEGSCTSYPGARQPIESGVRDARLFRVARADGLGFYWETEMTLGAKSANRRFASELHARAWLASSGHPFPEPCSFDLEELNGRFRSPNLVH